MSASFVVNGTTLWSDATKTGGQIEIRYSGWQTVYDSNAAPALDWAAPAAAPVPLGNAVLTIGTVAVFSMTGNTGSLEIRIDGQAHDFTMLVSGDWPAASTTSSTGSTASPPPPAPTILSEFDNPDTEANLLDAIQSAFDGPARTCMLSPKCTVNVSNGIVVSQKNPNGYSWGIKGNGARLIWTGAAGGTILQIKAQVDPANPGTPVPGRCGIIEGLNLDGNTPGQGWVNGAGLCLHLYAPQGDDAPLYKMVLRDIFTMNAGTGSMPGRGIVLEGGVYESSLFNVHAENHSSHGVEIVNDNPTPPHPIGITSAISIFGINSSRNGGAGIVTTYSTALIGGQFINNRLCGVKADQGLRYAAGLNGENTGESLFILGSNGYGSSIHGCELSSAGNVSYNTWGMTGLVSKYLLDCPVAISNLDVGNHCSPYGVFTEADMKVWKQAP